MARFRIMLDGEAVVMPRFRVVRDGETVVIDVAAPASEQPRLLASFQECQQGRCTCPTDQYDRLASVDIAVGDDAIRLRLSPKDGEHIEFAEIEACLAHTVDELERAPDGGGGSGG